MDRTHERYYARDLPHTWYFPYDGNYTSKTKCLITCVLQQQTSHRSLAADKSKALLPAEMLVVIKSIYNRLFFARLVQGKRSTRSQKEALNSTIESIC